MYLHLIRDADNHFVYSFECKMAKDLGPERCGCRRGILDTWKIHQICSELRSSWCVIHEEKGDSLENNIRYHINIKLPVSRWSEIGYCLLSHSSYGILLWPPRQTNASLQQIHKLSTDAEESTKNLSVSKRGTKNYFRIEPILLVSNWIAIWVYYHWTLYYLFMFSFHLPMPYHLSYRSCSVII